MTKAAKYLSYSALTADEKARIGNGCGAKWMPRKLKKYLFDWFFLASCNYHDFGYKVGGSEARRWYCDWRFFIAMLSDSLRGRWYSVLYRLPIAGLFYLAVMGFGWISFRYGKPYTDKIQVFN